MPVGVPTYETVRRKEEESVNFASELTAPRASSVFASTVENFEGVKFAILRFVPEYLGVLEIVKLAILPPNML